MVIGFNSTTLMYTNLYGDKELEGRYGMGVKLVGVEEFQTYASHISSDVKDTNEKRFSTCIVAGMFNIFCYINDMPYLEGDMTPPMVQEDTERNKKGGSGVCTNCCSPKSRQT